MYNAMGGAGCPDCGAGLGGRPGREAGCDVKMPQPQVKFFCSSCRTLLSDTTPHTLPAGPRCNWYSDVKETELDQRVAEIRTPQNLIFHTRSLLEQGKKVGVLVIDMQTGFERDFMTSIKSHVINKQASFLASVAGEDGLHVFFICYESCGAVLHDLLDAAAGGMNVRTFVKYTDDTFQTRSIPPWGGGLDTRELYGDIEHALRVEGIQDLVLLGCFDMACVYETARGALERDFSVVVDHDINFPVKASRIPKGGVTLKRIKKMANAYWDRLESKRLKLTVLNSSYEARMQEEERQRLQPHPQQKQHKE